MKLMVAMVLFAVEVFVIYSCAKKEGKVVKNTTINSNVNSEIRGGGEVDEPCDESM